MKTRSLVATVTVCLLALAPAGSAQFFFPFPGPVPAGNWPVNLYGAPTSLMVLGPGAPGGATIPSQLTIQPLANGNVSLQLDYNNVIVNPAPPPQAILAITIGDPLAPYPGWVVPFVIFNPPQVVNVYPDIGNLIPVFQPAVAAPGMVTFFAQAVAPGGNIPPWIIGSGITICLQGFFMFPQAVGPSPTYATCGWRVQF